MAVLPYRIDTKAGIVEISGAESDSVLDFSETIDAVLADPAYRHEFGFLRDRRGHEAPSTRFIQSAMALLKRKKAVAGTRWAVVVSDQVNYGMIRMASMLADGVDVAVFNELTQAQRWLIEAPADEPVA